jgi:thiamine biosynthesis lipoprotein
MLHHRFESMGTVVSVSARPAAEAGWNDVCAAVEEEFRMLDARFSLYREDSELSRIVRGERGLTESSVELREVYALAVDWRTATRGAFTPHRPDGVVDLNGVVKALAIERAGQTLTRAGIADWCVNAGGDVLVEGMAAGRPWTVGIADPQNRSSMLTSVELSGGRRAVATSGLSERGAHVWPRGGAEPRFAQVTVFAPEIVTADVLATAILAAPVDELDELADGRPADVLAVLPDGSLLATPGLRHGAMSRG